ncbi:MAG: hypothetical protein ACK6BG_03980 [Cyanobacteriota bacterium]
MAPRYLTGEGFSMIASHVLLAVNTLFRQNIKNAAAILMQI